MKFAQSNKLLLRLRCLPEIPIQQCSETNVRLTAQYRVCIPIRAVIDAVALHAIGEANAVLALDVLAAAATD
jgi:hypothetical protein